MKLSRVVISLMVFGVVTIEINGSSQAEAALSAPSVGFNWPDCTTVSEEFCIEKFEFTPTGTSNTQVITDAVPAIGTTSVQHPNTSVLLSLNGLNNNLYGKTGLGALTFELSDPSFESNFSGGTKTKKGVPDGEYRIIVRTGDFKPHSMTFKGKPVGNSPFTVAQGSDGNYSLSISATPEPFVTIMDSTKWGPCNLVKWDTTCEADTAFFRRLSGIITFIPPTFQDVEEVRAPGMVSVSPSLKISQGLWIASNTIVLDAKPEMNLVTKSLGLPAYGPHYVPTDFPTAGLTAEGSRHLNPAYFTAFIPNELLAFVNNFQLPEVVAKAPNQIRATIENSSGQVVTHGHETTMSGAGALVKVLITHYSAPNPKIYFGGSSGTESSTTATTTTSTTASTTLANTSLVMPKVTASRSASAKSIATFAKLKVLSTSKVSLKVVPSSGKFCRVSGASLKGLKAGSCKVTVTVTPKKGKAVSKTITLKVAK